MWHSALIDFGCVSSIVLWLKLTFSKVKVCVVVRYGPNEGNGKEREKFWNDSGSTVDRVMGIDYKLLEI